MYAVLYFLLLRVVLTYPVLNKKFESLSHIYSTYNETPGIAHYTKYGPAYDENISNLREKAFLEGRKVQMLEIGVQSGGSTRVWKRYFRGTLSYVGLDIDPRCKMFESLGEGVRIVIGNQMHTEVLSDLCTKYGPFDLVVDDGGHPNKMMLTSLVSLWNCMKDGGIYVIEDLHALNMLGGNPGELTVFNEMEMWMKTRSPDPNPSAISYKEMREHPSFHLTKLSFYDSIMFLHYGQNVTSLGRFMRGKHWLAGDRTSNQPPSKLFLKDWCTNCCIGCYND